jgi:hypothetical protein
LNHTTVWCCRHRFLKAAANNHAAILSGVIEADETFFVRSFKGDRGWKRGKPPEHRAARPSGWGAIKRGLSSPKFAHWKHASHCSDMHYRKNAPLLLGTAEIRRIARKL